MKRRGNRKTTDNTTSAFHFIVVIKLMKVGLDTPT